MKKNDRQPLIKAVGGESYCQQGHGPENTRAEQDQGLAGCLFKQGEKGKGLGPVQTYKKITVGKSIRREGNNMFFTLGYASRAGPPQEKPQ